MIHVIVYTLYFINLVIFALLSVIFFLRRNRSKADKRFFYFLFFGLLWLIDTLLQGIEFDWPVYLLVTYANFSLAALVALSMFGFALHFPKQNTSLTFKKEIIISIPLIVIALLSFSNLFVKPIAFRVIERTPTYYIYISVLLIYFLVLAGTILVKKLIYSSGIEKKRLIIISFAYLVAITILLLQSLFMNIAGIIPKITDHLITASSLLFSVITAYAMLRYRFMDYRVVLKKGFIYIVSLATSLAFYTYAVLLLKNSIESLWNTNAGWTAALLIFITVVGFIPIKIAVEKLINKLFKGQKSIDLAVKELKEDISEQSDAAGLAKLITGQSRRFLDVAEAHLFLGKPGDELVSYGNGGDRISRENDIVRYFQKYRDPIVREEIPHMLDEREGEFERDALQKVEKEMKKQKLSIAMPFVHEDGLFGLLTVGERESKEAFTVQDIQFLTKLREEIGFTLASALQYSYAMERIKRMQAAGEL